jgi:hypothetical protein
LWKDGDKALSITDDHEEEPGHALKKEATLVERCQKGIESATVDHDEPRHRLEKVSSSSETTPAFEGQ